MNCSRCNNFELKSLAEELLKFKAWKKTFSSPACVFVEIPHLSLQIVSTARLLYLFMLQVSNNIFSIQNYSHKSRVSNRSVMKFSFILIVYELDE